MIGTVGQPRPPWISVTTPAQTYKPTRMTPGRLLDLLRDLLD